MFLFAVVTHLQLVHEAQDLIITMGGLYYFVPLAIITCNENWKITMPFYVIISIFPVYKTFAYFQVL